MKWMLPLLLLLAVGGCPKAKAPGADVPSPQMLTASLERAVRSGDAAQVAQLLEQGRSVDGFDLGGTNTILHEAAVKGYSEIAALLIEAGADVNARLEVEGWRGGLYPLGGTPLYFAAVEGHSDTASLLLDHDADPLIGDEQGRTPLHMAAVHGNLDVAQLLRSQGADDGALTSLGFSPVDYELAYWCMQDDTEQVTALLDRGADPDVADERGAGILLNACMFRSTELVAILLERGADVDTIDANGETPLHLAAGRGSREIVQLVLRYGADTAVSDDAGMTPLHYCVGFSGSQKASNPQYLAVAKLLVSAGVDPNATDEDGETALQFATKQGCQDIADCLTQHTD